MATTRLGGARIDITGQSTSLEKAMRRAAAAYDKQEKDLQRLRKQAQRTNKAYRDLGGGVKGLATAALGGLGVVSAIKTVAQFEQAVANLGAITGATGKDLAALEKASLDLASTSTYTGSEVADAFKLVASAKPDLLESTEALTEVTDATLTLAEAAGIQLTEAATAVGATLNQFALASSEAGRVVNVLAAGSKFGAASIGEIAQSMKVFGVDAASAGVSVEEAAAAIETLAAVNIKGAEAGTSLRNIINKLDTHVDKQLRPSVVGLTGAFENLNRMQLDGNALLKLFGLENVTVARHLLGNVDLLEKLTKQVTGTSVAMEQAATRTATLEGKAAQLASAWERFLNTITDTAAWKEGLDWLTRWINKTSDAVEKANDLGRRGATPSGAATGMRFGWAQAEHLSGRGSTVLGNLLNDYETLSQRVTELGEHATQHQLDRLEALQKRIDRINAAGPVAQGLPYAGHVTMEPVGAAVTGGEHYTDPYGPMGLEAFYERTNAAARRGRDLLAALTEQRKKDAEAARAQADAEAAWAAEVEAARMRLLGTAGGGRGDPREIENEARLARWEAERKAEEAHTAFVEQQNGIRMSLLLETARTQIEAARDAERAWMTAAEGMVSSATAAFAAWISGAQSAEDAFRGFAQGVINSLFRIAQEAAALKLFGFLASAFGGGENAFLASGSGRVPIGFGARGGLFPAGRARVVGETGPELEFPAYQTRVVPFDKLAGGGGGGGPLSITVQGVQDPTAVRAEIYRLVPDIIDAVSGRLQDDMINPNALRHALAGGVGRG